MRGREDESDRDAVMLLYTPLGDVRNDLYVNLERGDFERGGKSVQKNVEVTVLLLFADGELLKVAPSYSSPFFPLS